MKKVIVSICLVLSLLCCLTLTGCSKISIDEAEVLINDYFDALENDDYETAAEYMHPINNLNKDSLYTTINELESNAGIDFSSGVELIQRTGISSYFNMNGTMGVYTTLGITYNAKIGNVNVIINISVISDKLGLSIYGFSVNPEVLGQNSKI